MEQEWYRASFNARCPISETDYRRIVSVNAGNYRGTEGFEQFTKLTAHYDTISFTTVPIDLETATAFKLQFGGTVEKID